MPVDGVIAELLVAEGETVEVGAPIVRFEVEGESGCRAAPDSEASASVQSAPSGSASGREDLTSASAARRFARTRHLRAKAQPAAVQAAVEPSRRCRSRPQHLSRRSVGRRESGAVLVGYGVKAGSAKRGARVSDERRGYRRRGGRLPRAREAARAQARQGAWRGPHHHDALRARRPGDARGRRAAGEGVHREVARDVSGGRPAVARDPGTSPADGRSTRVPVKSVRKRTAEAMVNSAFTAPHVTEFLTVDVTETMNLVAKLKADTRLRRRARHAAARGGQGAAARGAPPPRGQRVVGRRRRKRSSTSTT